MCSLSMQFSSKTSSTIVAILVGLIMRCAHAETNGVKSVTPSESQLRPKSQYANPHFITASISQTDNIKGALASYLLGKSMVPQDSNTTPNPDKPDDKLPQGTSIQDCTQKWQAYYGKKNGNGGKIRCCSARRSCMCFKDVCTKDPKKEGCKGLTFKCKKQNACKGVEITDQQCLEFQNSKPKVSSVFNWLWLLIIIAAIMIILICIAVCCVYQKKFTGKDTKKDKKYGKYTFGPMNVDSKVKWKGKKGSKLSRSSNKKSSSLRSKKKSRRSSSKKTSKKLG